MKPETYLRVVGAAGLVLIVITLGFSLRAFDISLLYFWQQTVPLSIREYLGTPGGPAEWMGVLVTQQMSGEFAGTVTILVLVLLVYLSLNRMFRDRRFHPLYHPVLLAALIPFSILFAYYRLPMALTVSIVIGYLLSAACFVFRFSQPRWTLFMAVILGLFTYWVAGSAGLAVVIQAMIVKAISDKQYRSPGLWVPLFCIPLLSLPLDLGASLKQAYLGSFIVDRYDVVPPVLFLSLGILLSIDLVFELLSLLKFSKPSRARAVSVLGILLVSGGLFFSTRASVQETERNGYRILEAGMDKDWDRVLDLCREDIQLNSLLQFEVNHALLQKGELLEKMFSYPQQSGEDGLFLERFRASRIALQMSGLYYDIGYANEAGHWATEAEMGLMHHPVVLRNLVMCYAAKGMVASAEKYLRILKRSKIHRPWCRQIRTMIDQGTINRHPDILRFIRNDPQNDFFASTIKHEEKLELFYMNNPENRRAFEYLMATALIQCDLGYIISRMPDFRKLGYEELPRHIQEAVCLYVTNTRIRWINLAGYRLENQVMEEYRNFRAQAGGVKDPLERKRKAAPFADTYWYYYMVTRFDGQGV